MKRGMTWLQEATLKKQKQCTETPKSDSPGEQGNVTVLARTAETGSIIKGAELAPAKDGETRQQRWKRLHPEKVRSAQAALMRKRRAVQKVVSRSSE